MSYDVAALTAAAQQVVADAKRLGLTWTLQTGTVTATAPNVQVQMDGDVVSIQVTSMIGFVVLGMRVYIIQVPPAGNFIVGFVNTLAAANGTWSPMSLLAGWTNFGSTNVTAQYRQLAFPQLHTQIVGMIAPGTLTNGTVIANLPIAFRPAHNVLFPVSIFYSGAGAFGTVTTPTLQALTTGDIAVNGLPGTCTGMNFNAIIPLDA